MASPINWSHAPSTDKPPAGRVAADTLACPLANRAPIAHSVTHIHKQFTPRRITSPGLKRALLTSKHDRFRGPPAYGAHTVGRYNPCDAPTRRCGHDLRPAHNRGIDHYVGPPR